MDAEGAAADAGAAAGIKGDWMADEKDCLFCKIVRGEVPSCKVYEDEHFIAFLDLYPANKGHTLVAPKKHATGLLEIPPKEAERLVDVVQKVARSVKNATKADGFNVLMNDGKAAGQIIFHVHFHVMPRYGDDKMRIGWERQIYKEGEMEEYRRKIAGGIKK
ncbi:HIT domain protein [Candidatus Gugararchaeum adminiculabundum]|nr:HIT domain protein [Candidatus Gugararchaeum adminiculabundum]